ncbi:hypothetical protein SeMB42_g07012 [Synchytrium endobioticum]|uniref:TRIP4/RQT4 C2HC5-type zinc finger domain-containing protein n=1 Tax=Synchytrium endobioticum TaxID=286115 RepID=A0A507CBJ8_9FUNG|nr:hypothetical protein SeMB42_g07012 [Synchytrium endobioticum]TPX40368.1 hypothetical protein SeLEV6574_g06649 [Synchytrium endobioticum]
MGKESGDIMSSEFDKWVLDRLSALLGLPVEELGEMLPSLASLSSRAQVEEHLYGMLGRDQKVQTFVNEFYSKRFQAASSISQSLTNGSADKGVIQKGSMPSKHVSSQFKNQENLYRKNQNELVYFAGGKKKPSPAILDPAEVSVANAESLSNQIVPTSEPTSTANSSETKTDSTQPMNKKARKERAKAAGLTLSEFDRLTTASGAYAGSKRVVCDCLGSKHGLLTNCLTCGRIICNLEGPGECFTCHTIVVSKDQQRTLLAKRMVQGLPGTQDDGDFQASQKLQLQQALEKAEQTKARLLDYDMNSIARTKVHDVASDFDLDAAARDKWASQKERQDAARVAQQKRAEDEERSKRRVLTIDVVNKRVTVEAPDDRNAPPETIPRNSPSHRSQSADVMAQNQTMDASSSTTESGSTGLFVNPTLVIRPAFVQVELPVSNPGRRQRSTNMSGSEKAEDAIENYVPGLAPKQTAPSRRKSISNATNADTVTPPTSTSQHKTDQTRTNARSKSAKPRLQTDFDDYSAFDVVSARAFDASLGDEPACG